jgi:hypothetical protein
MYETAKIVSVSAVSGVFACFGVPYCVFSRDGARQVHAGKSDLGSGSE